jgi:ABC-type multidrug transport system fused ATPase/permease subunit
MRPLMSDSVHSYWHEVRTLLGRDRRKLFWIAGAFAAISTLEVLGLGMVGPFIQVVASGETAALPGWMNFRVRGVPGAETALLALGLLMTAVFIAKSACSILLNFVVVRFCQQQEVRIRGDLLSAYLSMPYERMQRRNSAELVQSVTHLTGLFAGGVLLPGLRAFGDALVGVVLLGALAWTDPAALSILLVGAVGLLVAYDRWFRRRLREIGTQQNESMQAIIRGVNESFDGFRETRIFGRQPDFFESTMQDVQRYADAMTRMQVVASAPRYLLETVMVAFVIAVSLLAISRGESGQQALSTIGVFGFAAARLLPSANYMAVNIVQLRYYQDAVHRLFLDYMESTGDLAVGDEESRSGRHDFSTIELDDVGYTYPGADRPALEGISLRVHRGECVGIIGPSGAGKSTMANVLSGLVEPTSGRLLVDGRPLAAVGMSWISMVSYLPQSPFLFDGSLEQNIALTRTDALIDRPKLREAVRLSRLEELVTRLPKGLASSAGTRGGSISGGEAQRVVLARALYFDRPIVIFDESTSAMDPALEREVVEQVQGIRGTKTIFVIAHRVAALCHCDRIYRLVDGRLVECGSPRDMLGALAAAADHAPTSSS